jgi:hypothetical protein
MKELSREDRLWTLKGDMLIVECDKLGVKVNCNKTRTQLKESKAKVIDRILSFEKSKNIDMTTELPKKLKVSTSKSDLIELFKTFGYDLTRTNRKNAETYTFKYNKLTIELCRNKKGITLYCRKDIFNNSISVGNKFKITEVDVNNLTYYFKEV